ncbi:MAG: hypothetical protein JJD92_09150 [Frankiaceae bacterium]|nr:hypothetical protein [Frankiaceae bacterium]
MRKLVLLALAQGAALVAVGALTAAPALAATGGGQCQLDGTANFHPGPGADPAAAFAYDFSGALSACNSSDAAAPVGGTISAGQTYSVAGISYQEPTSTGTGSCATGDTAGTAIVAWQDGTVSVLKYTTSSAGAAVALQGTVVPNIVLTSVDGLTTTTVATTRYLGNGAVGALAFEVTDPTECTTSTGVTTAGIQGVTGIGSPS